MLKFFRPAQDAKETIENFRLTIQEQLKTSEINTSELKNYLKTLPTAALREIYHEISHEGRMSQYKKEELLIKLQKLRAPAYWQRLSIEEEHHKAVNDSMYTPLVLSQEELTKRYPHLNTEKDHNHYNNTVTALQNAHQILWSYTLVFECIKEEINIRNNQFYCLIQ